MSFRAYRKILRKKEAQEGEQLDDNINSEEESFTSPTANSFSLLCDEISNENIPSEANFITIPEKSQSKPVKKPSKSKYLANRHLKQCNSIGSVSNAKIEAESFSFEINVKSLNCNNEMEKVFGSKVVKRPNRKLTFSDVKDGWKKLPKPSIEMVENDYGFQFVHSQEYQKVQERFLDIVECNDIQLLQEFHQVNPTHIDCLLVLSEMYKVSKEFASSGELIILALYSLERCFHQGFIAQARMGLARLPYDIYENRAFHLVLFRHLQFAMRKGAWKSALEMAKFLLFLDFENDPLGILYLIDFLFLRCSDYQFLIDFYEKFHEEKLLSSLPNWSYSLSLAFFRLNQIEQSQECLKKSIAKFPSLLVRLNDKCSFRLKFPQVENLQRPIFEYESEFWNESERILGNIEKLYVERVYLCWKDDDILPWLKASLNSIDCSDSRWNEFLLDRKAFYSEASLPFFRHLTNADIAEHRFFFPPEIQQLSSDIFDPFPPSQPQLSYFDKYRREHTEAHTSHGTFSLSSLLTSLFSTATTNEDSVIESVD